VIFVLHRTCRAVSVEASCGCLLTRRVAAGYSVGYGKWCTVDAREWRAVDTTVDAAPYDAEGQKNASGGARAGSAPPD